MDNQLCKTIRIFLEDRCNNLDMPFERFNENLTEKAVFTLKKINDKEIVEMIIFRADNGDKILTITGDSTDETLNTMASRYYIATEQYLDTKHKLQKTMALKEVMEENTKLGNIKKTEDDYIVMWISVFDEQFGKEFALILDKPDDDSAVVVTLKIFKEVCLDRIKSINKEYFKMGGDITNIHFVTNSEYIEAPEDDNEDDCMEAIDCQSYLIVHIKRNDKWFALYEHQNDKKPLCGWCTSKQNLKKCGKCNKYAYCSKEHQKLMWPYHKKHNCFA